MALATQVVTIDLGFGGIDQKTDPKRVIPTRLTDAYNVRFDKTGRISRRYGYDVSGSTAVTFTRVIQSYNQIIGVQPFSTSMGNTWVKAANGGWSNSSQTARYLPAPEVRYRASVIPTSGGGFYNVDSAQGTNYAALLAQTGTTSGYTGFIVSNTTGKAVDNFSFTWARGRVLNYGNDKFLFGGANGTVLNFVTYDVNSGGFANASRSLASLPSGFSWDWGINANGLVFIAAGGPSTTQSWFATYTPDTSITSATSSNASATATDSVGVCCLGSAATAFFMKAGSQTVNQYPVTISAVAAPNVFPALLGNFANSGSANAAWFGATYNPAGNLIHLQLNHEFLRSITISGISGASPQGTAATSITIPGYLSVSKPLWTSSTPEPLTWWCDSTAGSFAAAFLVGASSRRILATVLADQACSPYLRASTPRMYVLPSINTSATGISTGIMRLSSLSLTGGTYGIGILDVSLDQNKHTTGSIENQAYLTGGFLSTIEAPGSVNEAGALVYPKGISGTSVSTGGALTSGTYSIVATYERYDRRGDRMISQVSSPQTFSVTTSAGRISVTNTFTIPSVFDDWAVKYYSTVANGSIYYATTLSSNHIATVTSAAEPLYTTGNVIENYQPSAPIAFATNGRRAICVEGDRPNFILISKEKGVRYALAFMEDVGRSINAYGDSIVDLKALNDKWIAFKYRSIFAATGDGPDNTGQNDTLGEFELVSPSIGCINKRTSVLTNWGIVFMSERGFYLLDSSLSLKAIGAAVSDVVPTTVVSVTLLEKANEVHYLLNDGSSLVLTFFETENGLEPRWSRNSNHPFSDMAVVDGVLNASLSVPVSTMSVVNQSTTFYDNQSATYSPYIIETAWIPMGSIQGFGRLYEALLVGSSANTSFTATVQIAYDYGSYTETKTISGANAMAGSSIPQWRIQTDRQKCESIKFKLTMASTSEGFQFNQIQLVIGVKGVANKMRAEKAGT